MKMHNRFLAAFASMFILSGLAACDNRGSAEKAGMKIDQVTENVSSSLSNAADQADQALTNQANTAEQLFDDTAITTKVKSALLYKPGMESMKITVVTENGIVTLSGYADTQEEIDKAIKIAVAVEGVKDVKNKLTMSK